MYRQLFAAIALLTLAACSPGPSDGDIESLLARRYVDQGLSDGFRVEALKRLSETPAGDGGVTVQVEYDLRFQRSLGELKDAALKVGGLSERAGALARIGALALRHGNFQAGDVKHLKEPLLLRKTARGWELAEG